MDLGALLAAWRTSRAVELAAAIERASMIAARGRAPITGHSQRALHEAWLAVEAAKDPADVDRLMATLAHGNMNQVRERLAALSTREPDPRVAAGLEAMLAAPPSVAFVKSASSTMWTMVFAELARIADPRTRTINERLPWIEHDRATSPFDAGKLRARTANAVAKVALAIAPPPPLTPEMRAICDAIVVEPGDRGADLLAKIYDDPHDLAARAVYGDWLAEQADPRGELIALQLARGVYNDGFDRFRHRDRHGSQRERTLLRTHQSVWSGPLGALLSDITFELGFPYRGTIAPKVSLSALAIPEVATLAHLVLRDPGNVEVLARRPFHGLRWVSGLTWRSFATLATARDVPAIRAARLHMYSGDEALPADLGMLASPWPLERLEIHAWTAPAPDDHVRAFMRTALVRRLRTLRIGFQCRNDRVYVPAFGESDIARLELDSFNSAFKLAVDRDDDGAPRTHITVPFDDYVTNRASIAPQLRERAATWPRAATGVALVEIDPRYDALPAERDTILAAAEQFADELAVTSLVPDGT